MGKRELLIVIAFIVVGTVAYQLTAPPAKSGEGFSFSRIFSHIRQTAQRDRYQASAVVKGVLALPAHAEEVRIANVLQTVRVIGENRSDIAYELTVDSTGPDVEHAQALAKQTTLKTDDMDTALAVRVVYPTDGRQTSRLLMRVPSRLGVRVDGSTGVDADDIRALRLEGVVGDVMARNISGLVSGTHRSGHITINGAGSATLNLASSTAIVERIAARASITARSSHCNIANALGEVEVDEINTEVTIASGHGTVRVSGTGGSITIDQPKAEVNVDVARAQVDVTLADAVPLSLATSNEALRLTLTGPPAVRVDAMTTTPSRITATDFDLTPDTTGDETRLLHAFGAAANTPRVVLRNQHAEIVIRKTK